MASSWRRSWPTQLLAALLMVASRPAMSYELDPNSTASVKEISKMMTEDMLSFYHGDEQGQEPGILPKPYYWWEAGAMMGALVEYWYTTGDDSYVKLTQDGLLAQVGEHDDYMPRAQNLNEGNDDQGFWGLAVMSAAEYNFPSPSPKEPQWLALAQAVFNTQAARWDTADCNGGLRWQIFEWNNGYDYKNTISQACFFALGARLALFTGNSSYADWATTTWDWMIGTQLIDSNWYVHDGGHIQENCTDIVPYQWSYNAGGFILGAAAMYNFTEDQVWKDRLDGLLEGAKVFFPTDNIMAEVACESVNLCNLDAQSFKAYLSRWLAAITKFAPYTYDLVIPLLRASAVAAASTCSGGDNGQMCGLVWNNGSSWDGSVGVGQQMAAMEVTVSCMVKERGAPLTSSTGGTSEGKPGAGGGDIGRTKPPVFDYAPLSAGNQAGAAILTILVLTGFVAGICWIMLDETSDKSTVEQLRGLHSSASTSFAALAAGGGAGAVAIMRRKNGQQDLSEKSTATQGPVIERTSRSSSENLPRPPQSMAASQVRSVSSSYSQGRMSNMPRGWPNNPSLRGSALFEPEPRRPQSLQPSLSLDGSEAVSAHSGSMRRL